MQSAEIRGLDVFSIVDGYKVGKVRDLLINAASKSVDYLLVEIDNWYQGAYVIPFDMAVGIGRDAVMVETEAAVKNIIDDPQAVKLAESGIKLLGNRVLTRKGSIIGSISEFYINQDTGEVLGCELIDQNRNVKGVIPTEITLTFGKDALIVGDDVCDYMRSELEQETIEEKPGLAEVDQTEPDASVPQAETKETEADEQDPPRSKAADLFEQKQQEYLLGRQVKKDVTDDEGNIVIKKDSIITREMIDKAMLAGKFKELMMNV